MKEWKYFTNSQVLKKLLNIMLLNNKNYDINFFTKLGYPPFNLVSNLSDFTNSLNQHSNLSSSCRYGRCQPSILPNAKYFLIHIAKFLKVLLFSDLNLPSWILCFLKKGVGNTVETWKVRV